MNKKCDNVRVFFPEGCISVIKEASIKYNVNEEWLVLIFWKFYKRLYWLKKKNKLQSQVPVNSEILFKIKRDYSIYMKALIDAELIHMCRDYCTFANKSRTYALNSKYKIDGKHEYYEFNKKTINNSFFRKNKISYKDLLMDVLLKNLEMIDIDEEKATDWAYEKYYIERGSNDAFLGVQLEIKKIKRGLRRLSRDEYGRTHTCFNNLPKFIRRNFLTYNGEPIDLVELDIPACQPTLLWGICRKYIPKESNKLKNALIYDVYEFLCEKYFTAYGKKPVRKFMKTKTLTHYFGELRFNCKSIRIIKKEFPLTANWIASLKVRYGYKYLSHMLQKQESNLMKKVALAMNEENIFPFFTIHDCVAIPREISKKAEAVFLKCLHEEGYDWITTLRANKTEDDSDEEQDN